MRALRALLAAGALLVLTTAPALADFGSFESEDGPSCTYNGFGSVYTVDCSGYSRSASRYVRYSCDYNLYGYGSASWTCRSSDGARWSGSR